MKNLDNTTLKVFETWPKTIQREWIAYKTENKCFDSDLPGIIFESDFAIVFEANPDSREIKRLDIKSIQEGKEEAHNIQLAIEKFKAEAMGIPLSKEQFNSLSESERAYWIYRWIAESDQQGDVGKSSRMDNSSQFIGFYSLGYAIRFNMNSSAAITHAEALPIDEAEDQAQNYFLAIGAVKNQLNKN